MTEETQKTCPPLCLLSALCPLFPWCRRDWVVSPVAEKPPASTAALLHSERVPQSGPANSSTPQDLVLVFCLFVCVLCVCAWKPEMLVSRVSSDRALLCLRQGLWLNLKPMHGADIVSTTYHIRIQMASSLPAERYPQSLILKFSVKYLSSCPFISIKRASIFNTLNKVCSE